MITCSNLLGVKLDSLTDIMLDKQFLVLLPLSGSGTTKVKQVNADFPFFSTVGVSILTGPTHIRSYVTNVEP